MNSSRLLMFITLIPPGAFLAAAIGANTSPLMPAVPAPVGQTKNRAWIEKCRVPEPRIFEIAAEIQGKVYAVTSGEDGKPGTEVIEYNPESDSWSKRKGHANLVRHSFGAATLEGKIYIWGGIADNRLTKSAEVYDPSTDRWTALAEMPRPRMFAKGAGIDGRLYAVGGIVPPGRNQVPLMDEYDPRANRWAARTEMPLKRDAYRVAASGGKIYVLGNLDPGAEVLEYDPISNAWKVKAAMPTPRFDFGILTFRGLIYTFGGMGRDTLEAYDPARDQWIRKQPMPQKNWEQVAAETRGKILVIGGGFPAPSVLDVVLQYDPSLDSQVEPREK